MSCMISVGVIAAAVITGLCVGVVAGMLGVGGGIVMLPVFRLGFGLGALQTTATSLFTIIPTSVSGVVTHIRGKTCIPKLGIALGIGGAVASPLGVWLAQHSPSWAVMVAAAVAICYSASTMLRKALALPKSGAVKGGGASEPLPDPSEAFVPSVRNYAFAVGIGVIAGAASGYIGLGGGFLMIPFMVSLMHLPMKLASGTSLVAVMILATPATIMQCLLGNVDIVMGIAVACGSIPGATIGARLAKRAPERRLRFLFAGLLVVAAILLVVKEFTM